MQAVGVRGEKVGEYNRRKRLLAPLSPVVRGEGSGVRGFDSEAMPLTPNPSPRSTGERGERGYNPSPRTTGERGGRGCQVKPAEDAA